MAETFSGGSFSSSYWIVRPVNYNHDRYRFYLYGKVNSYDTTNKRVNITVKCYCGAMYGGYIDFWSCYDDIHIQNGSTVINNGATRVYVSTIGRGYSSEATSYVNQCWTHTEAGTSTGETKHADGDFFTWTGNVNYNMNSDNNVGSLSLTMYHTVGGPTNQAYLPQNVDKTLRVTWNIPSIYKVAYNGNGGTAGSSEA